MSLNEFAENDDFIAFDFEEEEDPETTVNSKKRKREDLRDSNIGTVSLLKDSPWWTEEHKKAAYDRFPTDRLNLEVASFVDYISPNEYDIKARTHVVERVEKAVKSIWPDATVKVFGSFDTSLFLPSSDIDIVVFCPTSNELKKVAKSLIRHGIALYQDIKLIKKARIPLVKFKDALFKYDVDISFNIDSGIDSAKISKDYLEEHPALRPLLLLLKQFLSIRKLNEVFTGGLGSYATMLMVVHFLKLHPMLQMGLINEEENVGVLFLEFLELYGKKLNYEKVGLSLLHLNYYNRKTAGRVLDGVKRPYLLSIEDPQDPENDVTKSSYNMYNVKLSFVHAFNIL
ncbi:Nucleotidyltransferase, partial [Rozella allomycis CSF55]